MPLTKKQLKNLKDYVLELRAILDADVIKEVHRCADVYENAWKDFYAEEEATSKLEIEPK